MATLDLGKIVGDPGPKGDKGDKGAPQIVVKCGDTVCHATDNPIVTDVQIIEQGRYRAAGYSRYSRRER